MADKFEIPIDIKIKGDKGGKKMGEDIAEQMKKSLSSIGIGKGGEGKVMAKSLGKMGGTLIAILGVLDALMFLFKPVLSLLKIILILLFMPLIPAVKNIVAFFAKAAKSISGAPQIRQREGAGVLENLVLGLANVLLRLTFMFKEMFQPISDNIANFVMSIGDLVTVIIPGHIADFIRAIGDFVTVTIPEMIIKAFQWVAGIGERIWSNILQPAWNWFKDVGIMIWDIISAPFRFLADKINSIISWFSNLSIGSIFGRRADGGPVASGRSYVVGERGPEIFTPGESGNITPNNAIGGMSVTINNPVVRNDQDINKIANAVSRVLQRQMTGRVSSG